MSQACLAGRAGVAQSTLSRFEHGVTLPNVYTFRLVAAALDMTVSQLSILVEEGR